MLRDDLGADEPITAPYVLALGGAGGGCLAIEGTAAELQAFAAEVFARVSELQAQA